MSNVVEYSDFFYLRELDKVIRSFKTEHNLESVKKLEFSKRKHLTSLSECDKTSESPAALVT